MPRSARPTMRPMSSMCWPATGKHHPAQDTAAARVAAEPSYKYIEPGLPDVGCQSWILTPPAAPAHRRHSAAGTRTR